MIVRIVKDMAAVSVTVGQTDHYAPESKTVHLTAQTIAQADKFAVFRACHEGGHAIQHWQRSWLWVMRTEWLPVLTGLMCVTLFIGTTLWWINQQAALLAAGAATTLWAIRAAVIVGNEKEATDFAIDFIAQALAPEDAELQAGRDYLDGLRKSYWRVLLGR